MEGPASKRARLERSIDLSRYPGDHWVHSLGDNEFQTIFELGVKVKESLSLTVNVDRQYVDEVLTSKIETLCTTVGNIKDEISSQVSGMKSELSGVATEIKSKVTGSVEEMKGAINGKMDEVGGGIAGSVNGLKDTLNEHARSLKDEVVQQMEQVSNKVKPIDQLSSRIKESEDNVFNRIQPLVSGVSTNVDRYEASTEKKIKESTDEVVKELQPSLTTITNQVNEIATSMYKTTKKGQIGESIVFNILRRNFLGYTLEDTSTQSGKGDIRMTSPSGSQYLIEVKLRKSNTPEKEVQKFEKNVQDDPNIRVGILISVSSGIANHAVGKDFEIQANGRNQYLIYVPNALIDQNDGKQVIWSVLIANELYALDRKELEERQRDKIVEVYEEFKKAMRHTKDCRHHLSSLRNAMDQLSASLTPLLTIIDEAKKKLKKALQQ